MSRRAVSRAHGGDGREYVVLGVVAGTFVALIAGVWIWGALAGLAAGHGSPGTFADAARALVIVWVHLPDPAQAWDVGRAGLPGPAMMWAIFAALVAAGLAVFTLLLGILVRRGQLSRRRKWARWGTGSQLRELHVDVDVDERPNRIALGTMGSQLLAADAEASVLTVAPPRSMKTAGLVIPTLLEWQGAAVCTSVRGDLLQAMDRRRELGEVALFDPTGATGLPSAGWSPIAASATWQGARRTATMMTTDSGVKGTQDGAFWEKMAARFLSGLLFAAALRGASMRDVLRWVDTFDETEPRETLEASDHESAERVLELLTGLWELDEKPRSSLVQTTANALDPYEDPSTLDAEERATITPKWLLNGANTLFVVAPADDQARLRGLFVALITDIVSEAQRREVRTGGAPTTHLLLALDECANVAPLPNLDVLASTAGGSGIHLLTVFQSRAQAVERWGAAKADAIMASHRAQLYGTGLADQASLSYLREILGDEEVEQISSSSRGASGDTTYGTTWRPLVDGPAAREAKTGTAILIYGNLPPARIAFRPWFDNRRLTALVEGRVRRRTTAASGFRSRMWIRGSSHRFEQEERDRDRVGRTREVR